MTTVFRLPGNRPGPDISDSLLTTEAARIERGQQEISYNNSPRQTLNCEIHPRRGIEKNRLLRIELPGRMLVQGRVLRVRKHFELSCGDGGETTVAATMAVDVEVAGK